MEIVVEQINDVPLLMAVMREMGLAEVLDTHLHPHGNWGRDVSALSLGETIVTWLAYILSEGDHRMCAVEEWAAKQERMLKATVHPELRSLDLNDDRLGRALRYLADDGAWEGVEEALGKRLIRVYALPSEVVRVDTSTASTYASVEGDGLVQFGYSKTHRPDLPQVKIALGTLDPLGMPLASMALPGNRADDPLYLPMVRRARRIVGEGALYVGDSKMGALETRAQMQAWGDVYLCPASLTVVSAEVRADYIQDARESNAITSWQLEREEGEPLEGEGFKVEVPLTAEVDGERVSWKEERWVLRSQLRKEQAWRTLEDRLQKAEQALRTLNRRGRGHRRYATQKALSEQVEAILKRHQVADLLRVTYRREVQERTIRAYAGRPARVERTEDWFLDAIIRRETALEARRELLGWRVYLSNATAQGRTFSAVHVLATYHAQYRVEQSFNRMRRRPIGITPLLVRRDAQRKGLLRLFTLALRVLTVLQYRIRQALAQNQEALTGLYEGNPKRRTPRPTAERLLRAFRGTYLTTVKTETRVERHVSPLTDTQTRILRLLGFPDTIYTGLAAPQFPNPP